MDNTSALKVVRELHFMPSWQFEALDTYGDTIFVRATWETFNSNQGLAVRGYPQAVTLVRELMVHPEDYATADDLYAALITWLIEIQIHETREFFRAGNDFRAPFHPHRPEGERAWDNEIINASQDPMRGAVSLGL